MARAVALALSLTAVFAAAAHAGVPQKRIVRTTIVGEIRQLDPHRIAIGRLTCAVPAKLTSAVGRFVVGDPVRLSCRNGTLTEASYAPEVAANQSTKPGTGNAPTTTTMVTPPPTCGLPCASRISYFIGTIAFGGDPSGTLTTASGAISDISGGTVTVADLTCALRPSLTNAVDQLARVGDNVTLTCTAGQLTAMKSVGVISRS